MSSSPHVLSVVLRSSQNPLLYSMIKRLRDLGVRSTVATLDHEGPIGDQLADLEVQVAYLGSIRTAALPVVSRRLLKVVREQRPDVVHAHLFAPGVALALLDGEDFQSVITRHHNRLHHLTRKRLHARLDAWSARRVDSIIAVSKSVEDTMVDLEGVEPEKITVIHNGIDQATVIPDPAGVKSWRERFPSRRLVVAVGRVSPEKDYDTLLRAFAVACRSLDDLQLIVAGAGHEHATRPLEATARALGIRDRVEFIGWVERVQDLLSAAEVFLHSSIDEAFSLSILEALTLGVPVAATTTGGTNEAVGHFYPEIPGGDPKALGQALIERLTNDQARDIAAQAAAVTRTRFSLERMVNAHFELYQHLTL